MEARIEVWERVRFKNGEPVSWEKSFNKGKSWEPVDWSLLGCIPFVLMNRIENVTDIVNEVVHTKFVPKALIEDK